MNSEKYFEILEAITSIAEANPFGDLRPRLEAEFLKEPTISTDPLHCENYSDRAEVTRAVILKLEATLEETSEQIRSHPSSFNERQKSLYRNGVWVWIYHQHLADLDSHLCELGANPEKEINVPRPVCDRFRQNLDRFLILSDDLSSMDDPIHANSRDVADLFAFCFQLRRALSGILGKIVGSSDSVVELRCSIWEAIFTRRLLWSFQFLKDRMANFSTLILGPSGTGKDLVAEIIGKSQFIPFAPDTKRFEINPHKAYRAVNLAALTPTLIESELFGHLKGSFTGASTDRKGHLELCSPYGALFLDEIGDLSPEIQVKLLRVLQSREFYPLGGEKPLRFSGRILSATNRDISEIVAKGQMREDFLYRIGANVIHVPPLSERFAHSPEEADLLLAHILLRLLGREDREVYREIRGMIRSIISNGYQWPGNVREFEQCIRSLLISSSFHPLVPDTKKEGEIDNLYRRMESGEASLEEVISEYSSRMVEKEGNYRKAAERLGVDWRTIKKNVSQKGNRGPD